MFLNQEHELITPICMWLWHYHCVYYTMGLIHLAAILVSSWLVHLQLPLPASAQTQIATGPIC